MVLDSLGIMVAARDPIYSKRHTIYEAPPAYTCHVKINLGCGLDKRPGYINVDIRKEVDPDLVWDMERTPYPFPDESAEEILMKDSLEHVSWRKVEDVIRECHRILKRGGVLRIQVPDLVAIAKKVILLGSYDWDQISYWVYGGQDYPENTHKSGFTISTLKRLLERHGFAVEEIYNDGGTNIVCTARKL